VTEPPYPPQQPYQGYPPAYPPTGYAQIGYPAPPGYAPFPTGGRRSSSRPLLFTWIGCLGVAAICAVFCVVLAVRWVQAANRVGVPENSTATYGTVVATQGSDLEVEVTTGTPLLARSVNHTLGQTQSRTSITHAGNEFTAIVAGAPPLQPGTTVSFSFSGSTDQSRYLAVAPSRIKAATKLPPALIASLLAGIVLGLVGVILLIVWIVGLRRTRSGR
jgi:hypothetical protein